MCSTRSTLWQFRLKSRIFQYKCSTPGAPKGCFFGQKALPKKRSYGKIRFSSVFQYFIDKIRVLYGQIRANEANDRKTTLRAKASQIRLLTEKKWPYGVPGAKYILAAPAGKSQLFSTSVVHKVHCRNFSVVHQVHFGSYREGYRAAGWIRHGG